MYPSIAAQDDQSNLRRLSPCSLSTIRAVIEKKGGCLVPPHPCSQDDAGACCWGQQFATSGVVCQQPGPSDSCKAPALCNGSSSSCPPLRNQPDGTACSVNGNANAPGTCLAGVCKHLHDDVCAPLGLVGCTVAGLECMRACRNASVPNGGCQPLGGQCPSLGSTWNSPAGSCPAASAGTRCATSSTTLGTCNGVGMSCQPCETANCGVAGGQDTLDTFTCSNRVIARTSCSQPCGGGTQV